MGGPPQWMGILTDAGELAMKWAIAPVQGFKGRVQRSAYLSSTTTCRSPRSNNGGYIRAILGR